MLIWIWTRNDATGLLDDEFRDGDVFMVKPDSFETSIGSQEKKSWLIVKVPDPANYAVVESEIVQPEYGLGPTPAEDNPIRRKRKYMLDWRKRFTAEEIAIIEDGNQMLPDSDTVTAGVVHDLFTIKDLSRK